MAGIVAPPGVVWWHPDLKSGAKIRWQGLVYEVWGFQPTLRGGNIRVNENEAQSQVQPF